MNRPSSAPLPSGPPRHLAQINVATLRASLDDPSIDEFRNGLAPVNALADGAPGFVWRLQTDSGDATDVRMFDESLTIVNLTVWESVDALRAFAYDGMHRDFLRRRSEWFTDIGRRTALWYVPAGHQPTVDEAARRLAFLDTHGSSAYVFSTPRDRPALVVTDHPLTDQVSADLIGELDSELCGMYADPASNFFTLLAGQVAPGAGGFVVAWLDGSPVGCGAIRLCDDASAEVKRMFVRPEGRRAHIGAAMLDELEQRAIALGAGRLVLETGRLQHAAIGLYGRAGFVPCSCWGEYLDVSSSICFEKPIDGLRS